MGRRETRGAGRTASVEIKNGGNFPLEVKESKEGFSDQVRKDDDQEKFIGEMQDLLDTPFYNLNYGVHQFRQEMVSPDPRHWVVKWFFPNAEGGPVYVDYPRGKADMDVCLKKAKIMERLKLNYKLFRPEEEFKLSRAMENIGEAEAEIPAGEQF